MKSRTIAEILESKTFEEILPARASLSIIECIQKSMPTLPIEAIVLMFYTKVAQVLSIDRVYVRSIVHVRGGVTGFFPNIYSLVFLQSAGGKDYIAEMIQFQFMPDIEKDFGVRFMKLRKDKMLEIDADAHDEYPKDKPSRSEYMKIRALGYPTFETDIPTPASILSYRETLGQIGIGGVFFTSGEFTDSFESRNSDNKDFLTIMKAGYEGNTKVQMRKGEKHKSAVYGVPMNMLAYADDTGFLTNPYKREAFHDFLGRGYARRTTLCFAKPNKTAFLEDIDLELAHQRETNAESEELIPTIRGYFNELYETNRGTDSIIESERKREVYILSNEADRLLLMYRKYLLEQGETYKDRMVLYKEVTTRWVKALKLSCCISAFELPEEKKISADFLEVAIWCTEFYGSSYIEFISKREPLGWEVLEKILLTNKGKYYKTGDIEKLVDVPHKEFSGWFKKNIATLEEMLEETPYMLHPDKLGTGAGFKYAVIDRVENTIFLGAKTDESH